MRQQLLLMWAEKLFSLNLLNVPNFQGYFDSIKSLFQILISTFFSLMMINYRGRQWTVQNLKLVSILQIILYHYCKQWLYVKKKINIYRHLLTRIILTIFIKILLIMYVYCLNLFENFDRSANFPILTTTNYSVLY